MENKDYFFQRRSFAKRFLKIGATCSASILFSLSDARQAFLESLPKNNPQFALIKWFLKNDSANDKKQPFNHETMRKNLRRLEKQGLIAKGKIKKSYILTNEGKKIISYTNDYYSILKKPWDKKFRIVIFDIPEEKRSWRTSIRRELALMQYAQLQKSVYIGRYPLAKSFIEELDTAGVGENVFIFTVDQIERKSFILKMLDS